MTKHSFKVTTINSSSFVNISSSVKCLNYQVLNNTDRAKGFKTANSFKCDRPFTTDWYKFEGRVGTEMPDQVVPTHHCGRRMR